ncbi:hypothetical protein BU16DRAFT_566200 [Lophium mytilinum]|uniref:Uncharacterized protein n=1 Tax=Lophium mytilinum TaxID=390894 RepID=A0A6A6QEY1_9PEZI|nr:hypothetical protein BU16DRAFT_566200 [Lophium mytilinum]
MATDPGRPFPEHRALYGPTNVIVRMDNKRAAKLNQNQGFHVTRLEHAPAAEFGSDGEVNTKLIGKTVVNPVGDMYMHPVRDSSEEAGVIYLHHRKDLPDYVFGRQASGRPAKGRGLDVKLPGPSEGYHSMPKQAFRIIPDKGKNLWILQALAETALSVNGVNLIGAGGGHVRGIFHSSIYLNPEAANEVEVDELKVQIWTVRDAELAAHKSFQDVPTMAEYFAKKLQIVDGTATLVDPTVAVQKPEQTVTDEKAKVEDSLRYVLKKGGYGDFLVVIHPFNGKRLLGKFYDLEAGQDDKCERIMKTMASWDMPDDPSIFKLLDECTIGKYRVILTNTPERWTELSKYLLKMNFHAWSQDDRTLAANHFCRAIMTALEKLHARHVTMGELLPKHIAIHHLTVSGAKIFLIGLTKIKKHSTADKAFEKACYKDTKEAVRAMRLIMMYPDLLVAASFQETEGILPYTGPVKRSNPGDGDTQPPKKRKTDGEPEAADDGDAIDHPKDPDTGWYLKQAQAALRQAEKKWNEYKLAGGYEPMSHTDTILGTAVYNTKKRVKKFKTEAQKEANQRTLDIAAAWSMPMHSSGRRVYYNKVTNEMSDKMPEVADFLNKAESAATMAAAEEDLGETKPELCRGVSVENSYAYRQPLEDVDETYSFGHPILDAIFRDFGKPDWEWSAKEIIRQIRVSEGDCSEPWRTLDVVMSWKIHAKDGPDRDVLVDMHDLGKFFGFIAQMWPTWSTRTFRTKARAYIDKVRNPEFCSGIDLRALARDLAGLGNMPSQLADAFQILSNQRTGNFFELNNTFKLWYHVPSRMFNATQLLGMAARGPYERCKKSGFHPPYQQVRGDPELDGHYISLGLLPKLAKDLELEVVGTPAEPSDRTVDAADFSIVDSTRSMILAKKTSLRWAELDRISRNVTFQFQGKLKPVTQTRLQSYFFSKEAIIPDNLDRPAQWYNFNARKYPVAPSITNTGTACNSAFSNRSRSVTPETDAMLRQQLHEQAVSRIGPWLESTRPIRKPVVPPPKQNLHKDHGRDRAVEQESPTSSEKTVTAPEAKKQKEGAWQTDDFWVDPACAEESDEGWETVDSSDWETISSTDDGAHFDHQNVVLVTIEDGGKSGANNNKTVLVGEANVAKLDETDSEEARVPRAWQLGGFWKTVHQALENEIEEDWETDEELDVEENWDADEEWEAGDGWEDTSDTDFNDGGGDD